jgi:2-polyprenyl-3-methyl-5-hydroxy-6-metoxy-1,4-benzoquinol methylase
VNKYLCRICGSKEHKREYVAKEIMFSTYQEFVYDECLSCSSLQIRDVPDQKTLSSHYPKQYYSFADTNSGSGRNALKERFKRWAVAERDKAAFGQSSLVGQIFNLLKPHQLMAIVGSTGIRPGQRLLDVGCGAGFLLSRLADIGFKNALGVDPFIDSDIITKSGIAIRKLSLQDVPGLFDLIMFHHSMEHMVFPRDELQTAHRKLRPNGRCLIGVPTPSSQAWETYGVDWVQLDAPRHLTLISRAGMAMLAKHCGFSIVRIIDVSQGWSFMESELIRRGISITDKGSRYQTRSWHFSRDQIAAYENMAMAANAANRGDSVAFILVKTD